MKINWFLLVTAVLLALGMTACVGEPDREATREPAIQGPALIMFYTDN